MVKYGCLIFILLCLTMPVFGQGLTPAQASEKLAGMRQENVNPATQAMAEKALQDFINTHNDCSSNSDCTNILANCFGCTVAVSKHSVQQIYLNLADYHMRYGQCQKQCPVGTPAPICQNSHCILP